MGKIVKKKKSKGLGPMTKSMKAKRKAGVTNTIFRTATAKTALKRKTGLKRVSLAAVGVLDRRVQAYLTLLTNKLKALTVDRNSIRAADVRYVLDTMSQGPKTIYGGGETNDKMPFQKSLVAKFLRSKTPGKRWQGAALSLV